MDRPPPIAVELPDEDTPASPGEARLESLIEERLSDSARAEFARQLDSHDRERGVTHLSLQPQTPVDAEAIRRTLRFRGDVPEKTREILSDWVPGLVAFADRIGLSLRQAEYRIVFYHPEAFGREVRPLPPTQKLPASSYLFNPTYHHYTVRVVLPPQPGGAEAMFNVLRSLLSRLFGDIHLREAVYNTEVYKEDVEAESAEATVGLAEQVALLAEVPHTTPALESALNAFGRVIGLNPKRQADAVRKAYFKELREDQARGRLSAEREAVVAETFAAYLQQVRANTDAEIAGLVQAVEALNRQITFLPPEDAPDHERLKNGNPLHFLRAVKLRMEFLLGTFAGLSEDFESLDRGLGPLSPLAENRIGDTLTELERRSLARPYLVPGVTLSEELEAKRRAFPLEVHGLIARFPEDEPAEKRFKNLSRKLENSLHQRIYQALLLLRHWVRRYNQGRADAFRDSESYKTLKGLVANFRFRGPLVESLFIRIGVVLDVIEHEAATQGAQEGRRMRFPTKAFSRVWGLYTAQALLAGFLAERRPERFDAAAFWRPVEQRIASGTEAGRPEQRLMRVLHRIRQSDPGEPGLVLLAALLRQCPPAFRFAVIQALFPPSEGREKALRPEAVDALADAALEAHARSRRFAIVVGETDTP